MADILIRGMEMPNNVFDCPLNSFGICNLAQDETHCDCIGDSRPEWCPLVPLPEKHGRLGDLDAFKADCLAATKEAKPDFIRYEDWLKSCLVTMSFCRDIDERPTIVPAEGGTDNG